MDSLRDFLALVGGAIALSSLAVAAYNTNQSRKTNRARFWFDLRDRFAKFDDVHTALCPRGVWCGDAGFPETNTDLRRLEAYMGLFEHCSLMLQEKLIDWKTFQAIYEYRVANIADNPFIVQAKLIELGESWRDFLWLTTRMRIRLRGTDLPRSRWPFRSLPAANAESDPATG